MEPLEELSREDLIRMVVELRRLNERLQAEIQQLKRRGGAAPFSKGKPKQDPKPPGRKPGRGISGSARRRMLLAQAAKPWLCL